MGTLRSLCSAKMGWRGEIELRDAENGHACAKRSHHVSVTTKLACALTVVALAAATITVGGSYGYVAIPTAGSVGMTSQVKNVSTVSPSEADGARKKKLRQAPDAVAETHPRGINTQTGVDTKIAPKAVKDGDVQSDAPSTPSPTSLPYPTVTPNPTRWIRGCNRGRPLAEASIEQDPDVLSESADKTTQKRESAVSSTRRAPTRVSTPRPIHSQADDRVVRRRTHSLIPTGGEEGPGHSLQYI